MKCDCHVCSARAWEVENFLLKDEPPYGHDVHEIDRVITAAWDIEC